MTQSDMAEALGEIHKIDPNFDKETFIKECQFEIIPTILEAYLQGREDILKDWCHEGVGGVFIKFSIDQRLRHTTCTMYV